MKKGRVMSESHQSKLKVALIQMQSQSDISKNFEQAMLFAVEAINLHQAKLIVFPENFLCLGVDDYSIFVNDFRACIEEFKEFAAKQNASLLLGSIPFPVIDSNKKCYSRSILINEFGEIICAYDKIHLFDVFVNDNQGLYKESNSFEPGHDVKVATAQNRKLGLSICYDLRFPELYQCLRLLGAEIITVPSAFTSNTGKAHWEVLLRARAIETQCFILAANQCGEHLSNKTGKLRKTWGNSMIIDPWGRVLGSLKHSPGICSANLDFDSMKNVRQEMDIVSHKRL